jgi:integral membrane protein
MNRSVFVWIARAEGLSLLLLFGVAMPLKYGMGWSEATWWPGLAHGLLFLAYVAALSVLARAESWPRAQVGVAFVASLLPFGTFLFERRLG